MLMRKCARSSALPPEDAKFQLRESMQLSTGQLDSVIAEAALTKALSFYVLSDAQIVRAIQERGVNFRVTDEVGAALRGNGATEEVIQACKDSYRSEKVARRPSPTR
jgi:hypothetical protein